MKWDRLIVQVVAAEAPHLHVDVYRARTDAGARERVAVHADRLVDQGNRLGEWLNADASPEARRHYEPELEMVHAWLRQEHLNSIAEAGLRQIGVFRMDGESRWNYRRRGLLPIRRGAEGSIEMLDGGIDFSGEHGAAVVELSELAHTGLAGQVMTANLERSAVEVLKANSRRGIGCHAAISLGRSPEEATRGHEITVADPGRRRVPGRSLMRRLGRRRRSS